MHNLERSAAFLKNCSGEVCIALSDPAFVQSDRIVIDQATHHVFAIFREAEHFLGHLPPRLMDSFARSGQVLLSAMRNDGSAFELLAPVSARMTRH